MSTKLKKIEDGPAFGSSSPKAYTGYSYCPNSNRILIESINSYDHTDFVHTNIIYSNHARRLSKWLDKIANKMEKEEKRNKEDFISKIRNMDNSRKR